MRLGQPIKLVLKAMQVVSNPNLDWRSETRCLRTVALVCKMAFMVELRERHLDLSHPNEGTSASDLLQARHKAALAQASRQNM